MVNRVGFQVDGLSSVVRGLQAIGAEVEDLKDAFAKIADEGAQIAAAEAPKRTGRLAGDVRGNRAKSKAVVTAGRGSLPYAGVINYGWPKRNIAAAGYLQRADERMQPIALRRLEAEIDQAINRRNLS